MIDRSGQESAPQAVSSKSRLPARCPDPGPGKPGDPFGIVYRVSMRWPLTDRQIAILMQPRHSARLRKNLLMRFYSDGLVTGDQVDVAFGDNPELAGA